MKILKPKQEIHYKTQLSEAQISERLNNLLDTKKQTAPNVFGGTHKQNQFEIHNVNAGLWLTPKVLGTLSNDQLQLKLQPSKQFKLAVILMAFITTGLIVRLIIDSFSGWYFLPLTVVFFLLLVNFEGLKNYRNILETIEGILELTEKKEDSKV
ncbi:MAG: hypothetical protein ABJO02_14420 [Reichenbachiella sp.]|uniref:hypothetical protein n=1 Tax=Reichenbachiella sp. TaxID=2184521 RepID=UPI003296BC31